MYQGEFWREKTARFWGENSANLSINWTGCGLTDIFAKQRGMIRQFLNMVCRIIKKCSFASAYEHDGHDNWLLYPIDVADDDDFDENETDYITIGCVEEKDYHYLLDADFIYAELLKDSAKGHTIPSKEAYFSELYRLGVIRPYKRFCRDVVSKMKIEKGADAKWYCCIPCFLVNADLSKLEWPS